MKKLFETWCGISLVKRIVAGLIIGAVLGLALPQFSAIAILGSVFVGALKAVAPLLVFFHTFGNGAYRIHIQAGIRLIQDGQ